MKVLWVNTRIPLCAETPRVPISKPDLCLHLLLPPYGYYTSTWGSAYHKPDLQCSTEAPPPPPYMPQRMLLSDPGLSEFFPCPWFLSPPMSYQSLSPCESVLSASSFLQLHPLTKSAPGLSSGNRHCQVGVSSNCRQKWSPGPLHWNRSGFPSPGTQNPNSFNGLQGIVFAAFGWCSFALPTGPALLLLGTWWPQALCLEASCLRFKGLLLTPVVPLCTSLSVPLHVSTFASYLLTAFLIV